MSCLNPISVFNPAKRVSLEGGAPYRISVPCGSCSSCLKSKHDEYFFRAFYQARSCYLSGGFIQAITLTYRPSCLPHLSDFLPLPKGDSLDFPCFSRKDIRVFLIRLREKLYRYGYDVKGKLNFFMAAEYGTTEGKTHAPHYHFLFYVTFPISAFTFSQIVGECWPFGISDTIPFKSRLHVLHYTFGLKYTTDQVAMQKEVDYISKYVQKNSYFERTIKSRVYAVMSREFGLKADELKHFVREDGKVIFKSYYDVVKQFHRQGNNFGADFLKFNDFNEVLETGMIKVGDSDTVVRHIPLPMYYKRRLFYNLVKDFRGVRTWQLNDLGRDWFLNRKIKAVQLLSRHFEDWYSNLDKYFPAVSETYTLLDRLNHIHNTYQSIRDTLGNRSWLDFAVYVSIYKGRIKSVDQRFRDFLNSPRADDIDTFVFGFSNDINENYTFNYVTKSDSELFGSRFVCSEWLGSSQSGILDNYLSLHRKDNSMNLSTFLKQYVIDDTADERFRGFDSLFSLYCETCSWKSDQLTAAYNLKLELESKAIKPYHV